MAFIVSEGDCRREALRCIQDLVVDLQKARDRRDATLERRNLDQSDEGRSTSFQGTFFFMKRISWVI